MAQCYYPNGNRVDDPAFQPCVAASGTVSMCCATNRSAQADTCLSNGLCHNPCVSSDLCGGSTGGKYWRESCTDQSWKSEFCLKQLCTDPSKAEGNAAGNVVVSQCASDNTWCCGEMPPELCCRIEERISLAPSLRLSSSSMSRATSISTGGQTSGATSATSILSNPTSKATPSNNEMKMGIGVGIGVGVTFMAVVITFYLWWRRRKHGESFSTDQAGHQRYHGHVNQNGFTVADMRAQGKPELGPGQEFNQRELRRPELMAHDRSELGAG